LDSKAVGEVGGSNAWGVEVLDLVQDGNNFIKIQRRNLRQKTLMNIIKTASEVTVFIDGIDQGDCDRMIALAEARKLQLPG
jgi:hypothetical protein